MQIDVFKKLFYGNNLNIIYNFPLILLQKRRYLASLLFCVQYVHIRVPLLNLRIY